MEDVRIILSAIWAALMLSYLLGDVLRIYSGDLQKMVAKTGVTFTGKMWLGISMLMVIPCIMVVLTLTLDYSLSRWANIAVAIFFFGFNIIGLPSYPFGLRQVPEHCRAGVQRSDDLVCMELGLKNGRKRHTKRTGGGLTICSTGR